MGRAERVLWAFVMVLCFSRQVYLRFFVGSSMPFFLSGHVGAFDFLGGVPRALLYDNFKSAVLERQGDTVRFNPKLLEAARHHQFEVRPVAVARTTRRVERAIRYIRDTFFAARAFTDLDEWSEVFPNAACVVTLVDRLIHRAEVNDIEAESYRLKEPRTSPPRAPSSASRSSRPDPAACSPVNFIAFRRVLRR